MLYSLRSTIKRQFSATKIQFSLAAYPEAWNNLGVCFGKIERYEEAISSYEKAIKFKPDDPIRQDPRFQALISGEDIEPLSWPVQGSISSLNKTRYCDSDATHL